MKKLNEEQEKSLIGLIAFVTLVIITIEIAIIRYSPVPLWWVLTNAIIPMITIFLVLRYAGDKDYLYLALQ